MAALTRPANTHKAWGPAATRWTVLLVMGGFFVIPLVAMLEFSTREVGGDGYTWDFWRAIGQDANLVQGIVISLELATLTSILMLVLLVPTATWVRLRLPRLRRVIEFICILPLAIPAIVIVVGIVPIYAWVTYFFGDSPLTLTFVYVILTLPYAYRAIDTGLAAIDLTTLAEAARGLGASWFTVIRLIVVPNLVGAIVSATFLSISLVLGEFTIASLLNFDNMQVEINLLGKRQSQVAVAVSLAALIFAFVLLAAVSLLARGRRTTTKGAS